MTARHPMDCLLTPPDAARAMGSWLVEREALYDDVPWLDPFAGAGTLLEWALGDPPGECELHAWELDTRWGPELRRRVPAINMRLGYNSLAMDWQVRDGVRPHILTNPPYRFAHEAIARAAEYSVRHRRWVCMLLRTDIWQHPEPPLERSADHYLSLKWRPLFGLNKHGRMGSESSGSQWNVWSPRGQRWGAERAFEFLLRPDVPDELRVEHKRLARMAYEMGRQMARGA